MAFILMFGFHSYVLQSPVVRKWFSLPVFAIVGIKVKLIK